MNIEEIIEANEAVEADGLEELDSEEQNTEIQEETLIDEENIDDGYNEKGQELDAAAQEDEPDANGIAYLKAELEALRSELNESRAFLGRMEQECSEFSELYPDVPISSIPESIWQSVKSGVPLSAAYALEARKVEVNLKKAGIVNRENRQMSSGALSSDSYNDFFSPSQVRAMSPSEVRANYTKIINSMSKWH